MTSEHDLTGWAPKSENIFRGIIKKQDLIRMNWDYKWPFYVELLREREQRVAEYKKSSPKALAIGPQEEPDKRTVKPFPETTSGLYGWLSTRKEFQLEIFGSDYETHRTTPYMSSSLFYCTSDV